MPHRLRKVRKLRGSRSHGWGIRQHKGKGSQGGHGKAGGHKGKWTYTVKYEPTRYGKHGFQRAWVSKPTTLNVGELDNLVELLEASETIKQGENVGTVDLTELGVDKLLGSGKVMQPLTVKVRMWSKTAALKIELAGGKILKTITNNSDGGDG